MWLRVRPRRRTLSIALLAAVALAGGFMLFRGSPLVAVDRVRISGVRGVQAAPVSQALEGAARQMSTMDYSVGALQAAVARYPVVRSLKVRASFPHAIRIEVSEQLPVADLSAGGARSAVAADGVVLGPALASAALPTLPAGVIPGVGRRVGVSRLRSYLTVLGAAPAALLPLVSRVFSGQQGLTVKMANGLLVYFGDDARPHAKWDSLVSVLTAAGSSGASYVDVRLPERPAAGVPSGGIGSGESGQVSASDSDLGRACREPCAGRERGIELDTARPGHKHRRSPGLHAVRRLGQRRSGLLAGGRSRWVRGQRRRCRRRRRRVRRARSGSRQHSTCT